jgi:NOL1/NOP2/fmu family ribosome biogenesis protein
LLADIPATELSFEEAIRYLQREELAIDPAQKGWQAVRYQNHNLGWINALPGRINNYYPKEMRILKRSNYAP